MDYFRGIKNKKLFSIFILLILAVIPTLYYEKDLIIGSQVEINLDPIDVLSRRFYQWESRVALGHDIGYSRGDVFPYVLFYSILYSLNIPTYLIGRAWLIYLLFYSGYSMYELISTVITNSKEDTKLISSAMYMLNLYVIITVHGSSEFLMYYGALPLMLSLYIKYLNNNKKYDLFSLIILAFIASTMSGTNPPLVIINFMVLILYGIYNVTVIKAISIKKALKLNILFFLLYSLINLYWIIPLIRFSIFAWKEPIFSEIPSFLNSESSYFEVFRLLGYWGFYSGYTYSGQFVRYVPFSVHYINNILLIGTTFYIPLISLCSLLIKSKNKYKLFFTLLLIVCIPMAVGLYPPQNPSFFGKLYKWAYNNIPYFNIFRNQYKFIMPIALSYSVLTGLLMNDIHYFNKTSFQNKLGKMIKLVTIIIILINSWPLTLGYEFEQKARISEIPEYWHDLKEWSINLPNEKRFLILPEQYGEVYYWGHTIGHLTAVMLQQPQIYKGMGASGYNRFTTQVIDSVYDVIKTNSTKQLSNYLGLFNIGYILQRNDVNWEVYDVQTPKEIEDTLANRQGITLNATFNELILYQNENVVPKIYAVDDSIFFNSSLKGLSDSDFLSKININSTAIFINDTNLGKNHELLNWTDVQKKHLENDRNHVTYFTPYPYRGKFFERNAKGILTSVQLFVRNLNVETNSELKIGFSEKPNSSQIFSISGTIPKGYEGWISFDVNKVWDYESIFIYVISNQFGELALDESTPYDTWWSDDQVNYLSHQSRPLIRLKYSSISSETSLNKKARGLDCEYQEINPTKYSIQVNTTEPFFLIFSESYNRDWEISIDGEIIKDHYVVNGYANSWRINKTGELSISLTYLPQRLSEISILISIVISLSCLLYIINKKIYPKLVNKIENRNNL